MKQSDSRPDTDSWGSQLRKGSLELAILASLWSEPVYGLDILRSLKHGGLDVAEGTLYAILNRLRSDALVISEWRDAGKGHPRKYYSLTESGRAKTIAMANAWKEFSQQMDFVLQNIARKEARNGR